MTHKQKVLRLLSDGEPHTHHELYALGVMGHSRVSDLRKDGHRIDKSRNQYGDYVYRLVTLDEPANPAGGLDADSGPVSLAAGSSSVPASAFPPGDEGDRDGASGTLLLFPTPGRGAYGDAA